MPPRKNTYDPGPQDPYMMGKPDKNIEEFTKPRAIRPDVAHMPDPGERSNSPGWDKFAGGVRDGLGDFVMRLHGEHGTKQPEPEMGRDDGMDR
jgi:hypothetical protein